MQAMEPSELYGLFSRYFSADALDLLLTLCEDNAVILPASGQTAENRATLGEVGTQFLG